MTKSDEFVKGLAKAKENDFIAAIEHFTNAIAENNRDVESYAERAVAYLNSNQFDLSLFDMNSCIDLEPDNSYRYSCRGFLKAKMGDAPGAVEDYEIAVKLDPEDAIAYNNLGLALEQQGFQDKAQRSFQRSNELIGYDPLKRQQAAGSSFEKTGKAANAAREPQAESDQAGKTTSRRSVAKDVFTKKDSFRDFLKFIRNGFKIKQ